MSEFSRVALRVFAVLMVLILLGAAFFVFTVRRSFPQSSGKIRLHGLTAPVEVARDDFGVPHIYASDLHDLFFAQGYVHSQDRFWQMDVWRHTGAGRLSEMFGNSLLETDKLLRTMGWARVVQTELKSLDLISLEILEAYSEGVNAYLSEHQGSEISFEYALLALRNRQYHPEPWRPLDSLIWGKVMAWDLASNMDYEIYRALLLKTFDRDQVERLFPPYPADHPLILPFTFGSGTVWPMR